VAGHAFGDELGESFHWGLLHYFNFSMAQGNNTAKAMFAAKNMACQQLLKLCPIQNWG
jgi:hypothetical protein